MNNTPSNPSLRLWSYDLSPLQQLPLLENTCVRIVQLTLCSLKLYRSGPTFSWACAMQHFQNDTDVPHVPLYDGQALICPSLRSNLFTLCSLATASSALGRCVPMCPRYRCHHMLLPNRQVKDHSTCGAPMIVPAPLRGALNLPEGR